MKSRVYLFAVAVFALLAACYGGLPKTTPPVGVVAAAGTNRLTTAWGVLVDDPSGKPLAHVPVALEPWKPCRPKPFVPIYQPPWPHENWPPPSAWPRPEKLVCPKAIATTATNRQGRFTLHAPPGHYLLVIGSDSPADLTRPTIHDNVTLAGGVQRLDAPTTCPSINPPYYKHCLPPIPLVTPPAVERSTDYRLTTIDQRYEKPCVTGFDAQREARNLDDVVVDEWMTEYNRILILNSANPKFDPVSKPFGALSSGFAYNQGGSGPGPVNGHPGCWTWNVQTTFFYNPDSLPYSVDPRTHWYAGLYGKYNKYGRNGNFLGLSQYPRDPRTFKDPNVPIWP